jgi:PAS domain S-box-containing protein
MLTFKNSIRPTFIGLSIFCLLLVLTQFLSYQRYLLNKIEERERSMQIAAASKNQLVSALGHSFSATKTLAFIVENYGVPNDFDAVAKGLLGSGKFIDAIELTSGGTITHVYPLKGNEAAIGYDILKDTTRNREALKAIEKNDLFFAGPFQLKQGGVAVVGRQPIFKEDKFLGFAAVLIKFSTLVKIIGINEEINKDYIFQLSKINPDTHQEEFFLPYDDSFSKGQFISVPIANGEWNLYVKPLKEKTILLVLPNIIMGLIFSLTGGFFAWFISKKPEKLQEQVEEKKSKLNEAEQRFKSMVQEGSDLISILDPEGNYHYVSPACVAILARRPEDFFKKNAFDFIHPDDRKRVIDDFDKLKVERKIRILPFRFLDGHNKYRWLETTATNLMDDPAVRGLVVNSSDITARVNYINAIEGQNKTLREIAWMQSHVVRAPLARLMGLVNLLLMTSENFKEMSREEMLVHIQNSALELDGIIREIVRKTESMNIDDKV